MGEPVLESRSDSHSSGSCLLVSPLSPHGDSRPEYVDVARARAQSMRAEARATGVSFPISVDCALSPIVEHSRLSRIRPEELHQTDRPPPSIIRPLSRPDRRVDTSDCPLAKTSTRPGPLFPAHGRCGLQGLKPASPNTATPQATGATA